ncbi:hypothetical protein OESDEN_04450 [Oesophagostomum dentatum]|uniref:C-type lectin domain-containing protein n=1 Tax=Oesophagostomum dentatum TaxID=61180 RepID=A0A0B1TIH2_OESDE|nr:hypothetical protein OESDEN_04450 [Oesophagostomum dentatum]
MWSTYILFIAAAVNCITAKGCGTEWKLFPSTGYEYKVFCNLSTFQESERTCKKEGGHLASIHNEEENKFVHGMFPEGILFE